MSFIYILVITISFAYFSSSSSWLFVGEKKQEKVSLFSILRDYTFSRLKTLPFIFSTENKWYPQVKEKTPTEEKEEKYKRKVKRKKTRRQEKIESKSIKFKKIIDLRFLNGLNSRNDFWQPKK